MPNPSILSSDLRNSAQGPGPAALQQGLSPAYHTLASPAASSRRPRIPPGSSTSSRPWCTSLSSQFPLLIHSERRLLGAHLYHHPSPIALALSKIQICPSSRPSLLPTLWNGAPSPLTLLAGLTRVPRAFAHAIPSAWNSSAGLLPTAFSNCRRSLYLGLKSCTPSVTPSRRPLHSVFPSADSWSRVHHLMLRRGRRPASAWSAAGVRGGG